jgi:phenylacetaldehyde dehydrogenase
MLDGLPQVLELVSGKLARPASETGEMLRDSNDGRALGPQLASSGESIDRALASAAPAAWAPPEARAALLDRIAAELESRADAMALADATTTGVVLGLTHAMAHIAPRAFRAAAAVLRGGALRELLPGRGGEVEILREPWGPAAVIAPWNGPAAIAAHKVASALAAGCSVLLKPSEWAPHACVLIAEAVVAAGVPAEAFQMLQGGADVGARLVSDPRVRAVSFTGGLEGGRSVARACAAELKPVQLELGGNNPLVVLDDADVSRASRGVVAGLVTLNGQWCRALGRILVHASLRDALLEQTLHRLEHVVLGSSLDPRSEMGPLAYERHKERVIAAIEKLRATGGEVLAPTPMPRLAGWFVAPTIVTGVAPEDARDEVFGPVATVHTFDDDEEAVALANDGPFGLAGYVFGRDEDRARRIARRVRAGSIKINGVDLLSLHPDAPRPAWGLSGLGDEGTRESIRFFSGARVVGVVPEETTR